MEYPQHIIKIYESYKQAAPILKEIREKNFPHLDFISTWVTEYGEINGEEINDMDKFIEMVTQCHIWSLEESKMLCIVFDFAFGKYDNEETHNEIKARLGGLDFYDDVFYRIELECTYEFFFEEMKGVLRKLNAVESYLQRLDEKDELKFVSLCPKNKENIEKLLAKHGHLYFWNAKCDDGGWDNCSTHFFTCREDAYNDMRDAALEKMKWNTTYTMDDFGSFVNLDEIPLDDTDKSYPYDSIGYAVRFYPTRIIHQSYSGIYEYRIREVKSVDDDYQVFEFPNLWKQDEIKESTSSLNDDDVELLNAYHFYNEHKDEFFEKIAKLHTFENNFDIVFETCNGTFKLDGIMCNDDCRNSLSLSSFAWQETENLDCSSFTITNKKGKWSYEKVNEWANKRYVGTWELSNNNTTINVTWNGGFISLFIALDELEQLLSMPQKEVVRVKYTTFVDMEVPSGMTIKERREYIQEHIDNDSINMHNEMIDNLEYSGVELVK